MNFWYMMNNVLLASLNRGQFIAAAVFFIVLVAIVKMPSEDVAKLAMSVKQDIRDGYLVGYIWALFSTVAWYLQVRIQRKMMINELKRMSRERDIAQEKLIGKEHVQSSEDL